MIESITQVFNTNVTQPDDPVKEGYSFAGWYRDIDYTLEYTFTTIPSTDITVYAKWQVNQYTISFIENEGTEVVDLTQDYDSIVIEQTSPTREYYESDGWFTDETLNDEKIIFIHSPGLKE